MRRAVSIALVLDTLYLSEYYGYAMGLNCMAYLYRFYRCCICIDTRLEPYLRGFKSARNSR
jgi:hypothetical protein